MIGRLAIGLLFCAFLAAYEMRPQMHKCLVAFFPVMILIRVLVGLDGTACIGIVDLIT